MTSDDAISLIVEETLGEKGLLVCARCAMDIQLEPFARINDALDVLVDSLRDSDTLDRMLVNALIVLCYEIPDYIERFRAEDTPEYPIRQTVGATSLKVLEFVEDWNRPDA
jgi:hypothetical protein